MRHASLFSGIGGFDLAAQWMGWTNVFTCEIEEFPRKILKHHFPEAIHYEDIKRTDFTVHRGQIDILTGGFPCQPFSTAGKRLGKNDERHLWPEMYRAIREIRPRFIVGENVRGLLSWNDGMVLDEVYADLEGEGYEVLTFVLPAAGINAPHRRDRVWIVAHSNDIRSNQPKESTEQQRRAETRATGKESFASDTNNAGARESMPTDGEWSQNDQGSKRQSQSESWQEGGNGDASNANSAGLQEARTEQQATRIEQYGELCADASNSNTERWEERHLSEDSTGQEINSWRNYEAGKDWTDFPTQPPVCGGDDGIPARLDGIAFSKWRRESIKAYGNAIVPQIAYRIFCAIESTNNETKQP